MLRPQNSRRGEAGARARQSGRRRHGSGASGAHNRRQLCAPRRHVMMQRTVAQHCKSMPRKRLYSLRYLEIRRAGGCDMMSILQLPGLGWMLLNAIGMKKSSQSPDGRHRSAHATRGPKWRDVACARYTAVVARVPRLEARQAPWAHYAREPALLALPLVLCHLGRETTRRWLWHRQRRQWCRQPECLGRPVTRV